MEENFSMDEVPNYGSDGEWADASDIVEPDDSVSVVGASAAMPSLSPAAGHAVATTVDTANPRTARTRCVAPRPPRAAADTPFSAGDSELLPPRFSGDARIDADDWADDMRIYVKIRNVSPANATLLLQTRLVGAARTWLEGVPAHTSFDETLTMFRRRFGAGPGSRSQLMAEFWQRRQGPSEPADRYIEEMERLARRLRIVSEEFVLTGITQGLRPEIHRDVALQRPDTIEQLKTAARIAESVYRVVPGTTPTPNNDVAAQLVRAAVDEQAASTAKQIAELRGMITAMSASVAPVNSDNRSATDVPPPKPTSTSTADVGVAAQLASAKADADRQIAELRDLITAMATTGASATFNGQQAAEPAANANRGRGGRRGRGRPEPWRRQWSGPTASTTWTAPATAPTAATAAAWNVPGSTVAATTPTATTAATPATPQSICTSCGWQHRVAGMCPAQETTCFRCNVGGHFARCCPNVPPNAPTQQ